ncbi:MAG: shikimate dehydrogenase, partial [Elusimicrobia bacterium]|nr:shikimate dehydrogenase [Elusimicrobiota bacterium]
MEIHGSTQLTGIIGNPVTHTLSPAMHNAAYQFLELPWVYVPFLVKPADLAKAVIGLQAVNVVGVNVTLPHKEAVLEFVDVLDPLAKQIGAVNTIHFHNGKRYGYNTDAVGFLESLTREGRFNPRGKKVVLLGAGGAARAVAAALAQAGMRRLVVVNRNKE